MIDLIQAHFIFISIQQALPHWKAHADRRFCRDSSHESSGPNDRQSKIIARFQSSLAHPKLTSRSASPFSTTTKTTRPPRVSLPLLPMMFPLVLRLQTRRSTARMCTSRLPMFLDFFFAMESSHLVIFKVEHHGHPTFTPTLAKTAVFPGAKPLEAKPKQIIAEPGTSGNVELFSAHRKI